MDFLNNLKDNSILIIPNNLKDKVLDYFDKSPRLVDVKIMDFNELKKSLLFDYNNETIYKVMQLKNVSYDTAKDFINNLYYLNEDNYTGKLLDLYNLKKELEQNNLLIKDNLILDLFKTKECVYVYGYEHITKLNNYLLDIIRNLNIKVDTIKKEDKNIIHEAIKLKTIENEVQYVAEKISILISNGIPLDHIHIANYSEEYYYPLKKIFGLYNIPIYLKGSTKLSDTAIGTYFINNISDDMNTLLETIRNKYDIENNITNNKVYNKLFNLINTYYWATSYIDIKDLIEAEIKTISIPKNHYDNEIDIINITDNIIDDDEYVFLINFNMGSIPKTYKDEDYIEDNIKTPLMENTLEKNIISKTNNIKAIGNIKNLTITYKEVSLTNKYIVSTLLDKEHILESEEIPKYYSEYSSKYNKLLYASRLDNLIKFNEYADDLELLHNTYDINYKTYNNEFTGIDSNKIKDKLIKKGYSYSSISSYFECHFKYYLNTFFHLSKWSTTFSTFIGNAFHEVLDKCLNNNDLDYYEVYNNYIETNKKNLPYGYKEEYFVNSLKSELDFILNAIREQNSLLNITDEIHERRIEKSTKDLNLNTSITTNIVGIVDKCIFNNNDVYIIDYKTGTSAHIERDYFEYGVTIQLPIYLYLLKQVNEEYNIAGLYLQHILEGLVYKKDNKDYEATKKDRLKLDGLTLDDMSVINKFIIPDNKGSILRGYQINKDGDYTYPKRILTYDDKDKLYTTIKDLLEGCINNTVDGVYDIHPIKDKKINACEYCSYRDICYVREDQYIKITQEDNSLEEGESDE